MLLHGLERERAVEQIHVVHQRDLLQPLARVVVPVREPVDDQGVLGLVTQAERLHSDAHRPYPMGASPLVGDRTQPAHQRLVCSRPVVLGAQQQADDVLHFGHSRLLTGQQKRGRWCANWRRHDGQSCGTS